MIFGATLTRSHEAENELSNKKLNSPSRALQPSLLSPPRPPQ
jgi:hypothetical protein